MTTTTNIPIHDILTRALKDLEALEARCVAQAHQGRMDGLGNLADFAARIAATQETIIRVHVLLTELEKGPPCAKPAPADPR